MSRPSVDASVESHNKSHRRDLGLSTRILAEALPVLTILLLPLSVQAGVLTTVSSFFNKADTSTSETPEVFVDLSAHATPLLSARLNPEPFAIGGGDVVVDDGALVPNGGNEQEHGTTTRNSGEISVYVVREGDALSQIAEMFGVTTNTIVWANDLGSSRAIQPGQTLVILPIAGVQHKVAAGETLASIVKQYGADLDEVSAYNNLAASGALTVGTELIIPGGSLHTATEKTVAVAAPTKSSGAKTGGSSWLANPAPGALRTQGVHGYNGVDLAGKLGSAIRAAASGKVIVAKGSGWNGGYGSYIVVKHSNGAQTLYAHLSSVGVAVGETVSQGEVIGAMGNTGKSTGTHLHFEVRGGRNPF